ncbi:Protein of unknown function [Gryllus bimaculatus]|nr:Protein of unknown function [Gryllus bimaculatus]
MIEKASERELLLLHILLQETGGEMVEKTFSSNMLYLTTMTRRTPGLYNCTAVHRHLLQLETACPLRARERVGLLALAAVAATAEEGTGVGAAMEAAGVLWVAAVTTAMESADHLRLGKTAGCLVMVEEEAAAAVEPSKYASKKTTGKAEWTLQEQYRVVKCSKEGPSVCSAANVSAIPYSTLRKWYRAICEDRNSELVFTKCGFIMRPILISEDDDALFNANFTPRVAVTYQNHIKEIRRMVKQQGVGFWIRFITSFRSHNERHRLMDGIVFPRAEAVFVDMLHLLTCRDNLNELTRLVASLHYHVLMDPVLRVLMTCYDKPLDGLRLYFRFVAGLVVMFRRWRQVAYKSRKDNDSHLPWEPPLHWKEVTGRDYSEWTFEGHLLCMYGPELPHILGLPPGLLCWMPEELKAGHLLYPAIAMEEIAVVQDMNTRGNRSRKKCRRRKGRQFEEGFPGYEPYPANVTPTSGDSGVCLLEQGQDTIAMDLIEPQNGAPSGSIAGPFPSAIKEEHPTHVMEPTSSVTNESNSVDVNGNLSSDAPHNCETFDDINKNVSSDKCMLPPADVFLDNPPSPRRNMDNVCVDKGKDNEQGDVNLTSDACMKDHEDYIEESFTPYMNDCGYCIMPENFSGDWKKCNEDQFVHNHGLPYDQCLHIYRRDGPPRIMLGPNNFRSNCQMEEMPPMGRAAAWMEGPGNFSHPPPMGYFDAPVMDYMGPVSDLRRRGQQNRRFRQKRPRQPVGLAPIEECFDAPNMREQTSSDTNTFVQNEALPTSFVNLKKSWPKKKPEFTETSTEYVVENSTNSKPSGTDETLNCSASLETNANFSTDSSCQEPCSKGYALAVCGLLSKHTGRTPETKKETCKQEECIKAETANTKSVPYDKSNFKKCRGKSGKQLEEDCNDKFGKMAPPKDMMKETEKVKKIPVKMENSSVATNDVVKTRPTKGKMICKSNVTSDAGKTDKSGIDSETNIPLLSSLGKDSKSNMEIARNNAPCHDEERVMEKKRKWKSVWTRRRETEIHRPEEKLTAEGDVLREKEINSHHESDRRDGVPGNVPDILKQVENSELKSFWKENYEAPKPQRKTRPKRDTRWRQGNQECTSHLDYSQNAKKEDATPVVTPVVKLDIVPAVEPNDRENSCQDNNVQEQTVQQPPSETCVSEIGWYEETLAEDKDREDQREMEAPEAAECKNVKKNKNRKWKRKQRNNRKVKDEKSTVETVIKENSIDTTVVKDTDNEKENVSKTLEEVMQTKSSNGNSSETLASRVQKDESLVNGYTVSEVMVEQRDKLLTNNPESTSSEREINDKLANNNETHDAYEFDSKNVNCCKTILDNILLDLPENIEDSRKQSEVPLTEEKLTNVKDHEESVQSCSSILNELLNCLPEHSNNNLQSEIDEEKTSKDNDLKKNVEKDDTHHKCLDPGHRHCSGRSIGIPQPPPFVPRKKLLLRRCDNCNILEKSLGEYGECVRCKKIPTRLPRVYCNRMCQRADWKRRHRAEHKQQDSEENLADDTNCAFKKQVYNLVFFKNSVFMSFEEIFEQWLKQTGTMILLQKYIAGISMSVVSWNAVFYT